MMDMQDGMGWWMIWGGVMMLLFWGAVIGLIVWGVARFTGQRPGGADDALDLARRRYASGEISRDEFEQIRQDLA
jgi:putative membrane protein